MSPVAFLLITFHLGVPAFVLTMPDERTCRINLMAMETMVNDKASVGCFDMERQVLHMRPKPEGERVE